MTHAVAAHPDGPMVVLSLSTYRFRALAATWQRVMDAMDGVPARIVATLGPAIDAGELRIPASVEVHAWMPHDELLGRASLVVTHGGHGTTLAALASGVPVLVLPLDGISDQPGVGKDVARAGLGRTLSRRSSAATVRAAVEALLADERMHGRAERLGRSIRTMDGPVRGADAIQAVPHAAA
jgi:MGT family glycosyltransferase